MEYRVWGIEAWVVMRVLGVLCVLTSGAVGCTESAPFAYEECPDFVPLGFEPCRGDLSCSYTECGGECCANYECACSDGRFSCSHVDDCGGTGGVGGQGGAGGAPVPCQPTTDRCTNGTIEPHEPCCEQTVPDQANACDGTESTENPATCTPTESPITYRLTLMEVEDDCNVGYDLDGCDGESCVPTGLTPAEGASGIDNALAGFAPIVAGVGGNLKPFNKELSDAFCGLTEGRTCEGGDDHGERCIDDEDCRGADARCVTGDCRFEIPAAQVRFVVDANPSEGCANVTVLTDGEPSAHVLNLSDDGCMSGRLGTLPLPLVDWTHSLDNTVVRMTVSAAGFSHGRLGGTMDGHTAAAVIYTFLVGAVPTPVFDINASIPPIIDAAADCNGLSVTLRIGGHAE